jgi:hypothetical protein
MFGLKARKQKNEKHLIIGEILRKKSGKSDNRFKD